MQAVHTRDVPQTLLDEISAFLDSMSRAYPGVHISPLECLPEPHSLTPSPTPEPPTPQPPKQKAKKSTKPPSKKRYTRGMTKIQ